MKQKRIITLIIALALTLGSVLTMSSCLRFIDFYVNYDDGSGQGEQLPGGGNTQNGNPDGDQSGNQNGDQSNDQSGGGEQGSGEIVNNVPEFHPSAGGSLDGVSASRLPILSCVTVTSVFEGSYPGYDSDTAEGAGVIYKLDRESGDAYIITNFHVVYSSYTGVSNNISVYLYGQESENYAIPATYVGGTLTNDLAVLRVKGSEVLKNSSAIPVKVGNSDEVTVMDNVIAIGNPEATCMSVTTGIISVESETLRMTGADGRTTLSLRVMRISAAVNEGNSGGGLFNLDGELIGIVNAKKTGSDIDNIAYAIPTSVAIGIADNIIHFCDGESSTSLMKCQLGISLTATVSGLKVDAESGKIAKVELVEIAEVLETCIVADQLAAGDIINSITIDGVTKNAERIHHVTDFMLKARVGSIVTLNITRGGETFDVSVTLPQSSLVTVR